MGLDVLRFLILLVLLVVAGLLIRRWLRDMKVGMGRLDRHQNVPTVRCAHCGLFLPQAQAYLEGDRFYCCREHARLASERNEK